MFWAFNLSFNADILAFGPLFPRIGQNFIQISGRTVGQF
jgi:hypothetical protein